MTGGRYTGRKPSVVVGTWPSSFVGQISPIPRRAITTVIKPSVRSVLYCPCLPPSYLVISSHRLLLKELSARGIRQRPILAGQTIISSPRSLQQRDTAPPAEGRNDGPVIYLHRGEVPGISQPSVSAHGREEKKRFNEARVPGCFGAEPARGRGTRLRR